MGRSTTTAAAAERCERELILWEVPRADEVQSRVKSHRAVCGASPRSADRWSGIEHGCLGVPLAQGLP